MRFFDSYIDSHRYKYLPGYSKFLLDNHIEALVKDQLRMSREFNLPILASLSHLSEEQLHELGVNSMKEYLGFLSENKAEELVEIFLKRWKTNPLQILGKAELIAEDITLISYMRGRVLRSFVSLYTSDIDVAMQIVNELDTFLAGSTTATFNTYIQILREDITSHELALLEAQRISGIGSFEWNLVTNEAKNSEQLEQVFEMSLKGYESFVPFIHPADREVFEKAIAKSLQDGIFECEYRFQTKHSLKYIWAKGVVIFEDKKPVRFVGTVQDITDRKKAEQQLVEKTIALERSNESLQQFAFVASHDLQEPMRQISTFADIVLSDEGNISDSSRQNLQKVVNSAIRMRRMIDDILAYSTLTQWEGTECFELTDILKTAIETVEQSIEEKKAVIEYDCLPRMKAVPSQIQQLLHNLVSNALKFGRVGVPPKINISYEWRTLDEVSVTQLIPADKYLVLNVKDNGIGFDQQFATKIFGLFSRLNNKKDYPGSGIGLAIAKKIVENHGGIIAASSIKGMGTCFEMIFPQ